MRRILAGLLAALALASGGPTAAEPWAWDNVARVVVFGDLHGDYDKFHDMLVQAGLVDAHDNWSGGQTHLVQVGDVPDRAPDTRKIMDLLMKLEPQARKAGGYVHVLIGDHEMMNMEGDLRYTTPGEFAAFADAGSAARRDAYYGLTVQYLKAHPPPEGPPTFDAAYRAKFDAQYPLGWVEHQLAWSTDGPYGRWVLTHFAIIRIGDSLFMHGGLGPDFAKFDIDVINKAVIAALKHQPETPGGPHDILWADGSPLWYRGLAWSDEAAESADVAALLARYHVRHIVVGHTKEYREINARFDGAVIFTDVAQPAVCGDPHAFLIKEGDQLSTVYKGHRLALGVSGAAHDAYLAQITAIDDAGPAPAPGAPRCPPPTTMFVPKPPPAPATPPAASGAAAPPAGQTGH